MALLIEELEGLAKEGRDFSAAPASDISNLLAWGARRESLLARLRNVDQELPAVEAPRAAELIRQIVEFDATIIARLEQELKLLEKEIDAASKMRRFLQSHARHTPALLRRVA